MEYDEIIIDRILSSVSSIANRPFVRDVEYHYADYWSEFDITVNLIYQTTEMEWQELTIDMLDYLNKELPKDNKHCRWILSFWHRLRQIGLFFPEDTISDNCAKNA